MTISMLRHPFCTGEMTIISPSCAIVFDLRIDVQHDLGHLAPVRAFRVGVEQPQIRYDVFLVVCGQDRVFGGEVSNIGIRAWLLHKYMRLSSDNF